MSEQTERPMSAEEIGAWRIPAADQCAWLITNRTLFDTACLMPLPCTAHPTERLQYAVVTVQIVGNLDNWETVYGTDDVRHATRKAAIRHGWRVHDHDDWLLAHLRGDRLVGLSWQFEDRDDEDDQADVAAQCGWATHPTSPSANRDESEES